MPWRSRKASGPSAGTQPGMRVAHATFHRPSHYHHHVVNMPSCRESVRKPESNVVNDAHFTAVSIKCVSNY